MIWVFVCLVTFPDSKVIYIYKVTYICIDHLREGKKWKTDKRHAIQSVPLENMTQDNGGQYYKLTSS